MATNKKKMHERFLEDRKKSEKLSGQERLMFLLKMNLIKVAKLYSYEAVEDIFNVNLPLIESVESKEAALLMAQKAYLSSMRTELAEAKNYVEKALQKARNHKSNEAEAIVLSIKGYYKRREKQCEQAIVWYRMALEKASEIQKVDIFRDLGTVHSENCNYKEAQFYFNKALEQSDNLINRLTINEEKNYLLATKAGIISELAKLFENIGDLYLAEQNHEKAINLVKEDFTLAQYKSLSGKANFYILQKNFNLAEQYLFEAEDLEPINYEPNSFHYIAHNWAKYFLFSKEYEKALKKYEEILYGTAPDNYDIDLLSDFITNFTDLFVEVILGIYECLISLRIYKKAKIFLNLIEVYQRHEIFKEVHQLKRERQHKNYINILENFFHGRPLVALYGDFIAIYDTDEKMAVVKKEGKFFDYLSLRSFLIFKLLSENIGEYIKSEEINNLWKLYAAGSYEEATSSSIYANISRDLRSPEKLNLPVETSDEKGGGWRLPL